MPQIVHFTGSNDAIVLDFVEREATPKEMMERVIDLRQGTYRLLIH